MIITTNSAALLGKATSGDRRCWFRLVTQEVDRDGTVTLPAGVRLENFRQRPVFCWQHPLPQAAASGSLPPPPPPESVIGKVVEIEQTDEYLDILVEFAPASANPQAETCYQLVLGGFLGAVSWCGPELRREDRDVGGRMVPHIVEMDLWEASLVIVGSNPGAQVLQRALQALAGAPRTSSQRTKTPSKRSIRLDKDTLHEKLGMPGDVEHDTKAAHRALTRYLSSTTDAPEDRAKVCSAVEAHYPDGEPDGDEAPPADKPPQEKGAEGAEGAEGEAAEKGAEGDDIDKMDEETAKAALRMARRAALVPAGMDAKIVGEVDKLIADGQVPREERERSLRLHARGKLLPAIRAAGVKPGTFTTGQRLSSGRMGTPVSEADQQRLSTRGAKAAPEVEKDAKAILDQMHNMSATRVVGARS